MKKVFRHHNATTLHDAFITSFISKYDGSIIYTWTQIEAKATQFENSELAQKALNELTKDYSNNYSYTYSII